MTLQCTKFLIFTLVLILIGTWGINSTAEGSKIIMPTETPTGLSATAVSPTQINLSWFAR